MPGRPDGGGAAPQSPTVEHTAASHVQDVLPGGSNVSPGADLEQVRRGKIRLATEDAKATITLLKDADGSTFIHETGHHWLDELMRDAADPRSPAGLLADAERRKRP